MDSDQTMHWCTILCRCQMQGNGSWKNWYHLTDKTPRFQVLTTFPCRCSQTISTLQGITGKVSTRTDQKTARTYQCMSSKTRKRKTHNQFSGWPTWEFRRSLANLTTCQIYKGIITSHTKPQRQIYKLI